MIMDIPILQHTVENDLAGSAAWINALEAFLTTCGWTIIEKQLAKTWSSGSWIDDESTYPEHFLMVENTKGWQYRIRVNSTSTELQYFNLTSCVAGTTYTSSSTHPVLQTVTCGLGTVRNPIPTGTISKIWFFGNEDILYYVIQLDCDLCLTGGFGRPDVLDNSSDYYLTYTWIGYTSAIVSDTSYQSTIAGLKTSTVYRCCGLYYTGSPSVVHIRYATRHSYGGYNSSSYFQYTVTKDLGDYDSHNTYGINFGASDSGAQLIENANSAKRPLLRIGIQILDTDSFWFFAGYFHPIVFQNSKGKKMGEEMSIDEQKFICFPMKNLQSDWAWHGFRIE